jgi:NAD(P) transhydrogenase subunit beta
MYTASFLQDQDFIRSLYIVAFACFIYGLHELNHPRTARRGNRIAAVGMAIAVTATLLIQEVGNYGLIVLGVAGSPSGRRSGSPRRAA